MNKHQPKLYLGADHGGFAMKNELIKRLAEYEVVDLGNKELEADDDYPIFSLLVAGHVLQDAKADKEALGVIICRSAEGMAMATNKVAGIRTAVIFDEKNAVLAREKNGANVIALGADETSVDEAEKIIRAFVTADAVVDGRHARRIKQITRLDAPHLEIVPGVFAKTREEVEKRLDKLHDASDSVHIDVANNTFVDAASLPLPNDAADLHLPELAEVHLMVDEPRAFVKPWVAAGARRLIAHVEAPGFAEFLEAARRAEAETVAALDLGSDPKLLEPYLEQVDGVLVMTVKAGKSGQELDPKGLDVIARLADAHPDLSIEADGGVKLATVPAVAAVGATLAVATSALEAYPKPADGLDELETLWRHYHHE